MKTTATTEAVSSPPEEKWHWSRQWRRNTSRAGEKQVADLKIVLQNYEAERNDQNHKQESTSVVGQKPYGKCQFTRENGR